MQRRTLAASAAAVAAVASLVALPPTSSFATTRCAPNPTLTSTGTKALPNGVSMHTWTTTGKTMSRRPAKVQVTAVTAHLGRHVGLTSALKSVTSAHTTHLFASVPNAIATVNGDFFDYDYSYSNEIPYSAEVRNSSILKATAARTRVVGLGTDGRMRAGNLGITGTVTAGTLSVPLDAVNTPDTFGMSLYNTMWGPAYRSRGYAEVTVKNGKVVSTAKSRSGAIPSGAQVLAASRGSKAQSFLARLKVGSPVKWRFTQATDQSVKFAQAIGRGTIILQNRKNVAICDTGTSQESRSRTAIGWKDGGSTVIFLTINAAAGTSLYDGGLTYSQAAAALADAGATDGVLVDGGGSTTLEARTRLNGTPARYDQRASWERPVPNGLTILAR